MYWADPGYSQGALSSYYNSVWQRLYLTVPNVMIFQDNFIQN